MDNRFIPACVLLTLLLLATGRSAVGQLVINEVDYDQPSTDTAEFIELQNVGADAVELGDFTLELVNGSGGAVYSTIVLPARWPSCRESTSSSVGMRPTSTRVTWTSVPLTDLVQNGAPDAIGLREERCPGRRRELRGQHGCTIHRRFWGRIDRRPSARDGSVALPGWQRHRHQ